MISKEQFVTLRGGDVIVWRGKYLRTILSGPADKGIKLADGMSRMCVEFPIRHRSWTNRAVTTYNYNDIKHIVRKAAKRLRGLLLKSEAEVLKAARFDIRKEVKRQVTEARSYLKRSGQLPCAALERIERLCQ